MKDKVYTHISLEPGGTAHHATQGHMEKGQDQSGGREERAEHGPEP